MTIPTNLVDIFPILEKQPPSFEQTRYLQTKPCVILLSPQAPRFTEFFFTFYQRVWEKIHLFFASFLSKKEEIPPLLPPEILLAHKVAMHQQATQPNPLFHLFLGAVSAAIVSWGVSSNMPSVNYIALQSTEKSAYVLEKIASYLFPNMPSFYKKIGSLTLSTPITWIVADRLGYPLHYLFLITIAGQGIGIIFVERSKRQQQKNMQLLFQNLNKSAP